MLEEILAFEKEAAALFSESRMTTSTRFDRKALRRVIATVNALNNLTVDSRSLIEPADLEDYEILDELKGFILPKIVLRDVSKSSYLFNDLRERFDFANLVKNRINNLNSKLGHNAEETPMDIVANQLGAGEQIAQKKQEVKDELTKEIRTLSQMTVDNARKFKQDQYSLFSFLAGPKAKPNFVKVSEIRKPVALNDLQIIVRGDKIVELSETGAKRALPTRLVSDLALYIYDESEALYDGKRYLYMMLRDVISAIENKRFPS